MKKALAILLSFSLLTSITPVFAAGDINVYVDNKKISFDQKPYTEDGRILVPIRPIAEALGGAVSWNDKTQKAVITKGDITIELELGSRIARVNGRMGKLDVPAQAVNGRILVPVRFISEAFDSQVNWDGNRNVVTISTKESEQQNEQTKIDEATYSITEKSGDYTRTGQYYYDGTTISAIENLLVNKKELKGNQYLVSVNGITNGSVAVGEIVYMREVDHPVLGKQQVEIKSEALNNLPIQFNKDKRLVLGINYDAFIQEEINKKNKMIPDGVYTYELNFEGSKSSPSEKTKQAYLIFGDRFLATSEVEMGEKDGDKQKFIALGQGVIIPKSLGGYRLFGTYNINEQKELDYFKTSYSHTGEIKNGITVKGNKVLSNDNGDPLKITPVLLNKYYKDRKNPPKEEKPTSLQIKIQQFTLLQEQINKLSNDPQILKIKNKIHTGTRMEIEEHQTWNAYQTKVQSLIKQRDQIESELQK